MSLQFISNELMEDAQAIAQLKLPAGTLRIWKEVPAAWRVVRADDEFYDEAWSMWHGFDAEFWDGQAWRPISELQQWKLLAPGPANPPTTA